MEYNEENATFYNSIKQANKELKEIREILSEQYGLTAPIKHLKKDVFQLAKSVPQLEETQLFEAILFYRQNVNLLAYFIYGKRAQYNMMKNNKK